jgi:F0F1-type ATP synthase membrane subunit c/vacuolar-type H+-ATPase subunit K
VRVVIVNKPDGVSVRLRIDDVDIPEPAVEFARKVDPGKHTVKVFVAGFKPETRNIDISEKKEEVVEITLEESDGDVNLVDPWGGQDGANGGDGGDRGILPVLSWIGFSVGLAGLIVGIPTGIVAVKAKDTLEVDCKPTSPICPPEKQGDLDSAKTIAHVSTAGFVFAGVGIAVGVTGILIRGSLPDVLAGVDTPLTVRPYVGAGAVGVTGTF